MQKWKEECWERVQQCWVASMVKLEISEQIIRMPINDANYYSPKIKIKIKYENRIKILIIFKFLSRETTKMNFN